MGRPPKVPLERPTPPPPELQNTGRIHPELRPERIAWACASPGRILHHRKLLQKLNLPVPDCLKSTIGIPKQEKRRILADRDSMLAYGNYLFQKRANLDRDIKRKFDKKLEEMEEVSANIPNIQAQEAQIKDPSGADLSSLDGPRVGDGDEVSGGVAEKGAKPGDHVINYEILPSFVEFHNDLSPDVWCLVGPAGGGKSVAAIQKLLKHCHLHPNGARYAIIRNTYRMLYDTTIPTFFDDRVGIPRHLGKWDSSQEKFILGGKYEFFFRSCERPEDVDKFKGLEITGYFINEAMEVKEDVKNLLDQRIGRFPKEPYRDELGIVRYRGTDKTLSILDTNPPDQEHWIYERFVRNPLPNHRYVLQPPYENAHNLPPNYYERMRERYRDAPDLIARYIEGKWGAVYRGKVVYPEFDSRVHVAKEPLKYLPATPLFCGFDFGLTPACVWTQMRPNGTWAILAEMWADNMAADEFGDAVIRYTRQFFPDCHEIMWYGDPSGFKKAETDAKSVGEILAKKGIGLIPGAVALTARLEAVRKRLRMRNGILISPTCSRLVDGFGGGYSYKEIVSASMPGVKMFSDKPQKNKYSHIHDALQYIATGLFEQVDRRMEDELLKKLEYQPISSKVGW